VILLLASVFGASLLGSLHCGAMCGGIVCAVSVPGRALVTQAAWHAGRAVAYVGLGLAAGGLGQGLERLLAPSGVANAAAIVAGALLVVWGLGGVASALGWRRAAPASSSPLARPLAAALRALRDRPPLARGLAMGALTALLPCGWLWAFVASAAGTGHPLGGGLLMLAFWLGTVPVLAGLGLVAGRALGPLRRRLPLATAIGVVAIGLLTVVVRLQPHAAPHAHGGAVPGAPAAPEHVHGAR